MRISTNIGYEPRLGTLLYVVVKEQQKRIDALETRLANVEKLLCDSMNI